MRWAAPEAGHIPHPGRACLALVLALASCGAPPPTSGVTCKSTARDVALPSDLVESSGVAVSLTYPDVLWSHDDEGSASILYALNREGGIVARFPLRRRLKDWEDVGLAMCPGGGSCLYLADLGDNYEEHRGGQIVRLPEPDPARPERLPATSFPVRLPDGPRDIEALLVFPGERIMVVTKGRNDPITVYRYPGPLRPDTVTLEEVQRLSEGPRIFPYQVTGGAVSPRGTLAVIRTYTSLQFYRLSGDTLAAVADGRVDLRPLREAQGEGVGIGLDGLVALTSEGGPGGGPGGLILMRCAGEGL